MRLVDEDQRIVGQEVHQREGRLARLPARQVARIVLDAGAGAGFAQHFEVEVGALAQALRLEQPAVVVEPLAALLELLLDVADRELEFAARRDVVAGREDLHLVARAQDLAGHAIQLLDALDLISEELDPVDLLLAGGHDVDNIAAHAKAQPSQVVVVACAAGSRAGSTGP